MAATICSDSACLTRGSLAPCPMSSGRTMSGGVDIRALEIPKRIFGAARKLEDGGSLTIIASVLVEMPGRKAQTLALGLRKAAEASGARVKVVSRGGRVYLQRA